MWWTNYYSQGGFKVRAFIIVRQRCYFFIFSKARVSLSQSVCTNVGEKIAISRRINRAWRLIGWGEIRKGTKIELNE